MQLPIQMTSCVAYMNHSIPSEIYESRKTKASLGLLLSINLISIKHTRLLEIDAITDSDDLMYSSYASLDQLPKVLIQQSDIPA